MATFGSGKSTAPRIPMKSETMKADEEVSISMLFHAAALFFPANCKKIFSVRSWLGRLLSSAIHAYSAMGGESFKVSPDERPKFVSLPGHPCRYYCLCTRSIKTTTSTYDF